MFWVHPFQGTHAAVSHAEWDAATPNTLEVTTDRYWLSLAHFGASVRPQPPTFDLSRGGAHPKRIARLFFNTGAPQKINMKKFQCCHREISGGEGPKQYPSMGRTAKIRSSLPGHHPPQRRFAAKTWLPLSYIRVPFSTNHKFVYRF